MTSQARAVPFLIREYRPGDFSRLWEIDQLCFPTGTAYTQMELTGFISERKSITRVAEAPALTMNSSRQRIHGSGASTRYSKIVGFVVAVPLRGQIGHVVTLDILPEARRLGLASRLMKEAEQRLREAGCTLAYLETAVNNEPALRLYRKLGYKIVRTLPDYYSNEGLDAFLMAKSLETK
jgi:ribosomal protein S18 acetylase RimI-like enzyme